MSSNNNQKKLQEQNRGNWLIGLVIVITIAIIIIGTIGIYDKDVDGSIFKALGFGIIMLWACIFICYFIWATYFYNLNYGITNKDWDKIYEAKENRSNGLAYNQEDIDDEPYYNPYHEETFGLPSGTVRGMIAFTLLFGALALLVVSFGMDNIRMDSFFVDQFEFFKTAFLMMVAFYFGSRSLKYLKKQEPNAPLNTKSILKAKNGQNPNEDEPANSQPAGEPEIVVIGKTHTNEDNKPENGIEPITAIDPMASTKE